MTAFIPRNVLGLAAAAGSTVIVVTSAFASISIPIYIKDSETMRKRIVGPNGTRMQRESDQNDWRNLEQIATVEVTSEHPGFPIESVFASNAGLGWRASQQGEQVIRIIF
jgi:hypothetical protein